MLPIHKDFKRMKKLMRIQTIRNKINSDNGKKKVYSFFSPTHI